MSNHIADALPCTAINALLPGIDYTALATAHRKDEEMTAYYTVISGLVLEDVQFGPTDSTLLCNVSTGQPRFIIPAAWCRQIFNMIHNLAHPSI